jgi:hypothetical protein
MLLWLCLFGAFCGPAIIGFAMSLMQPQPKQFRGFEVIVGEAEVKDKSIM